MGGDDAEDDDDNDDDHDAGGCDAWCHPDSASDEVADCRSQHFSQIFFFFYRFDARTNLFPEVDPPLSFHKPLSFSLFYS